MTGGSSLRGAADHASTLHAFSSQAPRVHGVARLVLDLPSQFQVQDSSCFSGRGLSDSRGRPPRPQTGTSLSGYARALRIISTRFGPTAIRDASALLLPGLRACVDVLRAEVGATVVPEGGFAQRYWVSIPALVMSEA